MRADRNFIPKLCNHFSSLSNIYNHDQNVSMFTEDIQTAIMPFGGQSDKSFSAEIKGDDQEVEKCLELLKSLEEYDNQEILKIVSDSIRQIAAHIAWTGRSFFEIVQDVNNSSQRYL